MKGANASELEQKIIKWKASAGSSAFGGSGNTLGWNGVGVPPVPGSSSNNQSTREARLKALEQKHPGSSSGGTASGAASKAASSSSSSSSNNGNSSLSKSLLNAVLDADHDSHHNATPGNVSKPSVTVAEPSTRSATTAAPSAATLTKKQQDDTDQAEAEAQFEEQIRRDNNQDWGDDMVPIPVNLEVLGQLADMGFPDPRSRKALYHSKDSLEAALLWLEEHENDADIDQPYMVRKADALKANRPPLTEEEKAAKIAELKRKIEQKRIERARQERETEIQREKQRRENGQKIESVQEERERLMRKREADRIKKEKEVRILFMYVTVVLFFYVNND